MKRFRQIFITVVVLLLPFSAVAYKEVETQSATVEDKKETSLQPQKPSEAVFTVQVGAFKNASYAEARMAWLKEKGYNDSLRSEGRGKTL